ncbi:hypothetical protein AB1Y20_015630 [Prymnesium parvum]|uniref:Uncharacterized protein n=1 Tax=Prymnesium parvum TaxID=97485 RepID=A0AB34JZ27_PRYPA
MVHAPAETSKQPRQDSSDSKRWPNSISEMLRRRTDEDVADDSLGHSSRSKEILGGYRPESCADGATASSMPQQVVSILDRNRPLGNAALGGPASADELAARYAWHEMTLKFLSAGAALTPEGTPIAEWKMLKDEMELAHSSGAPLSAKARQALVQQSQAQKAIRAATLSAIRAEQVFIQELASLKQAEHRSRVREAMENSSRRTSQRVTRADGSFTSKRFTTSNAIASIRASFNADPDRFTRTSEEPTWFSDQLSSRLSTPSATLYSRACTLAKSLRVRPIVVSASRVSRNSRAPMRSESARRISQL